MKLKIYQAGESILRQVAHPLSAEEIRSDRIQGLIESMMETMRDAPGVGLAAPQVGVPIQLAVIEDQQAYIDKLPPTQAAARHRVPVPFHVLINPKLTLRPSDEVHFFEGCLSLAGFTAIVPRALTVRVDCLNEKAEPVTIRAEGWYARILQHEIDHLQGTLYIDCMDTRSFMTMDNYNRYWKEVSVGEFLATLG